MQVVLEADAPRVCCPAHGPTVVAVPWARHHAGHTCGFDDTVAWLAQQMAFAPITRLLRVGWHTIGPIVARVVADGLDERRLEALVCLGVETVCA